MDFPAFFNTLYPHMILIDLTPSRTIKNNTYTLIPPNQQDWVFTLSPLDDDVGCWKVVGKKNFEIGMRNIQDMRIEEYWIEDESGFTLACTNDDVGHKNTNHDSIEDRQSQS